MSNQIISKLTKLYLITVWRSVATIDFESVEQFCPHPLVQIGLIDISRVDLKLIKTDLPPRKNIWSITIINVHDFAQPTEVLP